MKKTILEQMWDETIDDARVLLKSMLDSGETTWAVVTTVSGYSRSALENFLNNAPSTDHRTIGFIVIQAIEKIQSMSKRRRKSKTGRNVEPLGPINVSMNL